MHDWLTRARETAAHAAAPLVKNLLPALLGLALGLALLGAVLPRSKEKRHRAVEQLRTECEVLIVGPSFVNSQVFPEVVDAAALEAGTKLRSCKFARESLKAFEMKRELETLLSKPWSKLRLVVFDVTLGPDTGVKLENRFKRRVLDWHTWDLLPWYLDHMGGQRGGKHTPYLRFLDHVAHVAVNTLLVGRGAEDLADLNVTRRRTSGPRSAEHEPAEHADQPTRQNGRRVAELLERRRKLESLNPAPGMTVWVLELRDLVRMHGAEGEGLIAPVWYPGFLDPAALPAADVPVVHAFDDPDKYPTLYAPGMHKDDGHLTKKGSREYSRLLGLTLATRVGQLK
jgi:hypothetical protein